MGWDCNSCSINVRRIGFCCSEITKHGGIAVAANIAPFKEDRIYNREKISSNGHYIEIFVDTSLDNCEKRDVKGLYKLARKGVIKEFTGITSRFDKPENVELVLNDKNTIEQNVDLVINYFKITINIV